VQNLTFLLVTLVLEDTRGLNWL